MYQYPPYSCSLNEILVFGMANEVKLLWPDYLVIALMIIISVGIGIYYRLTGGRQKTFEEYFSASRSMKVVPVAIALMVSFMSAITLLGVSAENYNYGSQFVVINIAYLLGTPLVCYGYLPVFYKLQATSAFEYLEKRFGVEARLMASFVLWIQLLMYSGIVLYAPALAFETTTGLEPLTSILGVGLACTIYSSIGGIRAVLITDIFQAGLMFASLGVVIATAAYSVGGLDEIWNIASAGGRLQFDNISVDPTERHTWWSLITGGLFTFLSLYGVNQIQIQRLLTVKSLKSAQNALWISWPILTLLSILTCFSGLAIYSRYYNCDPLILGRIEKPDMLMPLYVMDTLSSMPGLPGLFIAGIFSAGLSTISAALNSLAAVTLEDYVKPIYFKCTRKEMSASNCLILGKILAFALGILCIAFALVAQYLGNVLQTSLTVFGVVGGPLLGLFTLGMLCQSATKRGAMTGTIIALLFLLWIAFGGPRPRTKPLPAVITGCSSDALHEYAAKANNSNSDTTPLTPEVQHFFYLYRISYMWYAPLGCVLTILIGYVVSNISQSMRWETPAPSHPDLFFPFIGNRIVKRKKANSDKNPVNYILPHKYTIKNDDVLNSESTPI